MARKKTLQDLVKWGLVSLAFAMFFVFILFPISTMFSYGFIDEQTVDEARSASGEELTTFPDGNETTWRTANKRVLWDGNFRLYFSNASGEHELSVGVTGVHIPFTAGQYRWLEHGFIIPGTLTLRKDNVTLTEIPADAEDASAGDFRVDYERGSITLIDLPLRTDWLTVDYEYAPYEITLNTGEIVLLTPPPSDAVLMADYDYTVSSEEKEFDPRGFYEAITTEDALTAFKNSLLLAFLTTFINLVVGTLLAYVLVRYSFPGKEIFRALIDMPIAIPTAVVGLALITLYGPSGVLGPMMTSPKLLFSDPESGVLGTLPLLLMGHIFVTFPYMVRSVSVVLEKLDASHEEAARTLGATQIQTFFRVTLPAIRSGLVAGAALVFTRSLGEFGSALILAAGMILTGPIYIYEMSDMALDFQAVSAVAIVLMIFPFFLLLSFNYLVKLMED